MVNHVLLVGALAFAIAAVPTHPRQLSCLAIAVALWLATQVL